ncbi:MAG: hypothetical protein CMM00_00565 [Rhodopirellula sp.]|nr:hypothetical protein [Rhodopirellula sp.]
MGAWHLEGQLPVPVLTAITRSKPLHRKTSLDCPCNAGRIARRLAGCELEAILDWHLKPVYVNKAPKQFSRIPTTPGQLLNSFKTGR